MYNKHQVVNMDKIIGWSEILFVFVVGISEILCYLNKIEIMYPLMTINYYICN